MSIFKKRHHYSIPERLTPDEARARRLNALLERERRFMDVPNFPAKIEAVRSRVVKEDRLSVAKAIVNEPNTRVHKAALIAAALARFKEPDFSNKQQRTLYRALRAQQESLKNVRPTGTDTRQFNPTGKSAHTIFGTAARTTVRVGPYGSTRNAWQPRFVNPSNVFPCIQRAIKREVMFALGFGGRGYHTRKRRTQNSGIPC